MIKTEGILLRKNSVKEYDEHLVFFTKDFGKIHMHAFGSRSPKSSRRHFLSKRDFLIISCEKIRGGYHLKQLEILKKNDFLENVAAYRLFFSMLKVIDSFSDRFIDAEVYHLIFSISMTAFFSEVRHQQTIIIYLSLLKCLGVYPYFSECSGCGELCSESYRYDLEMRQYFGIHCLKDSKEQKEKPSALLIKDDIIFLNQFYLSFIVTPDFFIKALNKLNKSSLEMEKLVKFTTNLIRTYR